MEQNISKDSFLDAAKLVEGGPDRFTNAVERLLIHLGFHDISNIDGSGDEGGDLIARKDGHTWVLQCKWKKHALVSEEAVREVANARSVYSADRALVVTNTCFSRKAESLAESVLGGGAKVDLLTGDDLRNLFHDEDYCIDKVPGKELRLYQQEAFTEIISDLDSRGRALFILATGLGKTVVAGEVINHYLRLKPEMKILVLAHVNELVLQLERAIWWNISKSTPTQVLNKDSKPDDLSGITVATFQSAITYVEYGYRPDMVVVDEAHHISDSNTYSRLLNILANSSHLGMTATPWRGDKYDLEGHFGPSSYAVSIEEGMKLGYLAQVDYRLYLDNINWELIESKSKHSYTLKNLNQKLFLPQRDERIRDELLSTWMETKNPRAIVFCRTIAHAKKLKQILNKVPGWELATDIHNDVKPKRERQQRLLAFGAGKIPILIAVDIVNEGVDVPDVNIVCFVRVTHSRRIFIQQLGRGLRIAEGKDYVKVLDFVSDIRRVASLKAMRQRLDELPEETIFIANPTKIEFTDLKAKKLMDEWIKDAASLETAADEVHLQFPDYA